MPKIIVFVYIEPFLWLNLPFYFLFLKTVFNISDYSGSKKTIATIGTFDGVHLGHRKILENLVQQAKFLKSESLVLSFFPYPKMVFQKDSTVQLLNTIEEKIDLFEQIGIDNVIIHPFDLPFSNITAEDFVQKILMDKLNIQKIIIGYDHRFGKNRTANIDDLVGFGKKYGFEVEQISAQTIEEVAISSTKIREAILEGNIKAANNFLGYNYFFSGVVVRGNQLGRTIGFPTANMLISNSHKLIPKNGVYIIKSKLQEKSVFGMMNIGIRPTVNGTVQTIEAHFFDFDQEIYEQTIQIEVIEFIRLEQKFNSLEELKRQIEKDKQYALSYISKRKLI